MRKNAALVWKKIDERKDNLQHALSIRIFVLNLARNHIPTWAGVVNIELNKEFAQFRLFYFKF